MNAFSLFPRPLCTTVSTSCSLTGPATALSLDGWWEHRNWEFIPFPSLSAFMCCQVPQFMFEWSVSGGFFYQSLSKETGVSLPAVNQNRTTRRRGSWACRVEVGLLKFVIFLFFFFFFLSLFFGCFFSGSRAVSGYQKFVPIFTQSVKCGFTARFLQHSWGSWDIPFSCIFNNFLVKWSVKDVC